MVINQHHLCIGCMHEIEQKDICPNCGLKQTGYKPIPRCLIPGTQLAQRYVLGKVLGEGSFGITYIGYDKQLEMPVAIKEYYPSDLVSRDVVRGNDTDVYLYGENGQEEYRQRLEGFLREARRLTRFNQLHCIVSVRDFFYANNTAYMVMDCIAGESLKKYIMREGPMDAGEVLRIFRPILESLEKIHATGMIHRDISPDNLLFDEEHNLVMIDFGAAELQNTELTRTVAVIFKRGFSPEEQYRSHGKQGPWTDIYALCASMYYAMTGQEPDEAIQRTLEDSLLPLSEYDIHGLTNHQMNAIMQGMAVYASDRYQNVKQLYDRLYETETHGGSDRHTESEKQSSGRRWMLLVAGISVLLGLVVCMGYFFETEILSVMPDSGMESTQSVTTTQEQATAATETTTQEQATAATETTTQEQATAATETTTQEQTTAATETTTQEQTTAVAVTTSEQTTEPVRSTQTSETEAPKTTQASKKSAKKSTKKKKRTENPAEQMDGFID